MSNEVTAHMLRTLIDELNARAPRRRTTSTDTTAPVAEKPIVSPIKTRLPPPETPEELAKLKSALAVLSPDEPRGTGAFPDMDYGRAPTSYWLMAIWAIRSLNWDGGREIAREWSRRSERYTEEGFDKAWNDYDQDRTRSIGIGSLYKLAKALGWPPPNIPEPDNLFESHGDIRNARAFARAARGKLIYVTPLDQWMIWTDEKWRPCEKEEQIATAKTVCQQLIDAAAQLLATDQERGRRLMADAVRAHNINRINAMVRLAISEHEIATPARDLDANPRYLGVSNGVIDLQTGNHLRNRPEYLITRYCTAAHEPKARCQRWLEFLDEVFAGDTDTIDAVQVLLGYTLLGIASEEILVICHGHGSNGKSVFGNVIQKIMGDYAVTAPPSLLTARKRGDVAPRNDLAALSGSRLVSINELQSGDRLDEQIVKILAGREPISARFLHKEFFEFSPTFTAWLRTNHRPVITGDDDGIWRRLVLLPFERQFTDSERDPHLEEKLLAEKDGILLWMVEGSKRYSASGFIRSPRMNMELATYRKASDLLGEFLADKTNQQPTARVEQRVLYERYRFWCGENGICPMSKKSFTQRLTERGIKESKSGEKRYYVGLE